MAQKVILITGCSSGIGLKIATQFGKDAAKKYLVYSTMRNLGKQGPLQAEAGNALNDTMFIRPLDVVDDDSVTNAVKDIINEHGRIDILVNNAGIASFNPIEYSSVSEVREIFETNFFGTVRMMQAVLPIMKEQKSGHVINISSATGGLGFPFYESYCASKFAAEGMTEALAIRLKAFNIKLSSVCPAAVDTNINENIVDGNRLPNKHKVDSITKEQMRILATNQKDYFLNKAQTVENIADIVQGIVEMHDIDKMPVRFGTSDITRNWIAKKYSDYGAGNWVDYVRFMIDKPCALYDTKPKHDESQV